jgi:ATP-dependent protease HslVU (ClpYQ) ATPase subunit
VTLKGLSQDDLYRILTEPVTNLIRQQIEMLKSEMVTLSFTDEAIKEIARVAFEVRNCFFASSIARLLDCYLTATVTAVATAVAPLLHYKTHSIASHRIMTSYSIT